MKEIANYERAGNPTVDGADDRSAKGDRTRQTILEIAVDLASVEGLEGLTIGRLAQALSI